MSGLQSTLAEPLLQERLPRGARCGGRIVLAVIGFLGLAVLVLQVFFDAEGGHYLPEAVAVRAIDMSAVLFERAHKVNRLRVALDTSALGKAGHIPMPAGASASGMTPSFSTGYGNSAPKLRGDRSKVAAPVSALPHGGGTSEFVSSRRGPGEDSSESFSRRDAVQRFLGQRGAPIVTAGVGASASSESNRGAEEAYVSSKLSSRHQELVKARSRRDMLLRVGAGALWLQNPWPQWMRSVAQSRTLSSNSTVSELPVPLLIEMRA